MRRWLFQGFSMKSLAPFWHRLPGEPDGRPRGHPGDNGRSGVVRGTVFLGQFRWPRSPEVVSRE